MITVHWLVEVTYLYTSYASLHDVTAENIEINIVIDISSFTSNLCGMSGVKKKRNPNSTCVPKTPLININGYNNWPG